MLSLAEVLGLQGAEISATPTLVEISLGSIPHQRSYTLRVRPTPVDLDAIARLDDLVRDTLDGRDRRARGARQAGGHRGAAAETPLVRAARRVLARRRRGDAGPRRRLAGPVGRRCGRARRRRRRVRGAASCARGADDRAARRGGRQLLRGRAGVGRTRTRHPTSSTLAALVTLLPGMALTVGVRELATEHLQSGVANTANALVQLLGLVVRGGRGTVDRSELVRRLEARGCAHGVQRDARPRRRSPPVSRSR